MTMCSGKQRTQHTRSNNWTNDTQALQLRLREPQKSCWLTWLHCVNCGSLVFTLFPVFSLDLSAISFSFLCLPPLSVFHIVPQTIVTWNTGYSNKQGGFSVWLLFMSCVHTDTFRVGLQGRSQSNIIICTDKPILTLSRNNAMPNHQEEDLLSSTFHYFG